jgi:hypothetical protein
MALSMDEQRMLAEIERRLAAEDPGLASKLSSFRKPARPTRTTRTRGKVIGSICTIVLLAVIGVTVYAMGPFRAHSSKTPTDGATSAQTATSAPAKAGPSAGAVAG